MAGARLQLVTFAKEVTFLRLVFVFKRDNSKSCRRISTVSWRGGGVCDYNS